MFNGILSLSFATRSPSLTLTSPRSFASIHIKPYSHHNHIVAVPSLPPTPHSSLPSLVPVILPSHHLPPSPPHTSYARSISLPTIPSSPCRNSIAPSVMRPARAPRPSATVLFRPNVWSRVTLGIHIREKRGCQVVHGDHLTAIALIATLIVRRCKGGQQDL
jgi:hypothetical protein